MANDRRLEAALYAGIIELSTEPFVCACGHFHQRGWLPAKCLLASCDCAEFTTVGKFGRASARREPEATDYCERCGVQHKDQPGYRHRWQYREVLVGPGEPEDIQLCRTCAGMCETCGEEDVEGGECERCKDEAARESAAEHKED